MFVHCASPAPRAGPDRRPSCSTPLPRNGAQRPSATRALTLHYRREFSHHAQFHDFQPGENGKAWPFMSCQFDTMFTEPVAPHSLQKRDQPTRDQSWSCGWMSNLTSIPAITAAVALNIAVTWPAASQSAGLPGGEMTDHSVYFLWRMAAVERDQDGRCKLSIPWVSERRQTTVRRDC